MVDHSLKLITLPFAALLEFAVGIAQVLASLDWLCLPRLLDAYDEHQALLKEQETLKRRAENGYGLGIALGASLLCHCRYLSALNQLMSE